MKTNFTQRASNAVLNRLMLMASTCVLAFVAGTSHADDLEIFNGLTTSQVTTNTTLFPNLLFVLDTSGSMRRSEPSSVLESTYDPSIDYGSSPSDTFYVYDETFTYTGVSVPRADNNCATSLGQIDELEAEGSNRPVFFDNVATWGFTPATTIEVSPENCNAPDTVTPAPSLTGTINAARDCRFNNNGTVRSCNSRTFLDQTLTVDGGVNNLVINMQNPRVAGTYTAQISYRTEQNPNFQTATCSYFIGSQSAGNPPWTSDSNQCPSEWRGGFDTSGFTQIRLILRFQFSRTDGDTRTSPSTAVSVVVDRSLIEPGVCTPTTIPATGDWYDDFFASPEVGNSTQIIAIECGADEEGQTLSEYPRYARDTDTVLNEPTYVSSISDPRKVDWSNQFISEKYIVPSNYHDFRTNGLFGNVDLDDVIDLAAGTSAVDHCAGDIDRGGDLVRDNNGNIFLCVQRIESLKRSMDQILSTIEGVNIGMARFNTDVGGSIVSAVASVGNNADTDTPEEVAHRESLLNELYKLPGSGQTPLQESLYTAFQYYQGGQLIDEDEDKRVTTNTDRTNFNPNINTISTSITDSAARSGGRFVSPVQGSCQDNSIILLSDGEPRSDRGRRSEINALASDLSSCGSGDGECLVRLAEHMANNDVFDGDVTVDGTTFPSGENNVYTYTIAFGSDVSGDPQGLLDTANAGRRDGAAEGSQSFTANTSDDLTTVFEQILRDIGTVESDSFVAPAVAVNAFNRLQFRDDLYFALFQPDNRPRWPGNIKKFRIDGATGNVIDFNNPPQNAIGDDGFFLDSAVSDWGPDTPDGPNVSLGGVVSELNVDPARQLFANLSGGADTAVVKLDRDNFLSNIEDGVNPNTGQANFLNIGESFGLGSVNATNQNRQEIIDWTLGYEIPEGGLTSTVGAESNFYFGESLHSTPFVVDYGEDGNPEDILFVTTNQGMLHAISGDTGEELWAYIPDPDLLPNLGTYYNNVVSDTHRYGLDSEITFEVSRDENNDVSAQIYLGQRRGGDKYFALDVSEADGNVDTGNPVTKLWTIDGTTLPGLGQSWARPVTASVNWCPSVGSCEVKEVLFISGGYDTVYDQLETVTIDGEQIERPIALSTVAQGDVSGNAIYMVDKENGELLWMVTDDVPDSLSSTVGYLEDSAMQHSIPSEPVVVDSNFDGIADMLFAVDIAGNVWRFDFVGHAFTDTNGATIIDGNDLHGGGNNAPSTVANREAGGGIIANLSPESADRRFYNRLDISLTPRIDDELARFNIVTGSGNRARPTTDERSENRIYFLFDRNIVLPRITEDTNGDIDGISYAYASNDQVIDSNDIVSRFAETDLDLSGVHEHGFFIPLETTSSERMLNPTLTEEGTVIAVSFSPEAIVEDDAGNLCQANTGSSSLYLIDLLDGSAARTTLLRSGISARPVVIEVADPDNPGDTVKVLVIGSESFDVSGDKVTLNDDDSDIDILETPGLGDSEVGGIRRVNWWEVRDR